MIIFVTGSREGIPKEYVWKTLESVFKDIKKFFIIIHGGAKGVDLFAHEYCIEHKIDDVFYEPNYEKYGRGAPFVRNTEMAEKCDICVAIWDGQSKGTKHAIDECVRLKKPLKMFATVKNMKKFVGIKL